MHADAPAERREELPGRAADLAWVRDALGDARTGRSHVIVVRGEPGIGKSAFASAAQRQAAADCWTVVRLVPDRDPSSLRPFVTVLRALADHDKRLRAEDRAGAVQLITDPAIPVASSRTDGIVRSVLRAAAQRAVLIVVDDLSPRHTALCELLDMLAARAGDAPVALLITAGTGDERGAAFADLARRGTSRTLGPLDEGAIAAVAAERGVELPDPATVRAWTGGNPAFLAALFAGGHARPPSDVPVELRVAVDARLDELTPAARRLADVLALSAGCLTGDEVDELAGVDGARQSAIDELRSAGLVAPTGPWLLQHGVVGDRLWELLGDIDDLVVRVDTVLAAAAREGRPDALAAHAELARRAAARFGPGHATSATLASAEASLRAGDVDAALTEINAGLEATDPFGAAAGTERAELLLALGRASKLAGNRTASSNFYAAAAMLARDLDRPDLLADAAIGTPRFADPQHLDLQVRALVDEALLALDGTAPGTRAVLLARRATEMPFADSAGRRSVCDEALALARTADDGAVAEVLRLRPTALNDPGLAQDRLDSAREFLGLAERSGDPDMRFDATSALFVASLEAGLIADADAALDSLRRQADATGSPLHRAYASVRQATMTFLRGDFAAARGHAGRAAEIAAQHHLADVTRLCASVISSSFHICGDPTGANMMRSRAASDPLPGFVFALFLHQAGYVDQARHELRRGLAQMADDRASLWLGSLTAGAEIADRLQDCEVAAAVLGPLRSATGPLAVTGAGALCLGVNEQFVGQALSGLGRYDEAIEALDRALELSFRTGFSPFVARTQVALVRALRRRRAAGDLERAASVAVEARELATSLGMIGIAETLVGDVAEPAAPVAPAPAARRAVTIHQGGDVWHLDVEGRPTILRSTKGLTQLATLLDSPGREVRSTLLAGAEADREPPARAEVLDPEARRAYRQRIAVLDEQRQRATARGDADAEARIDAEQDALVAELRRLTGLSGRSRAFTDEDERARVNVTRTLRAAVERIFSTEPDFGMHLAQSIRTGARCVYVPDTDDWSITVRR